MNMCERLKADRKRRGMSQSEYAKWAKASTGTINKLENDETAWHTMMAKTVDKIAACLEAPLESETVDQRVSNVVKEEVVVEPQSFVVISDKKDNSISGHDKKTLTLIEFAYEGLIESKTHSDFVANLHMLRRILNKY